MKGFLSALRDSLLLKNPALTSLFGLTALLLATPTLWDAILYAAMTGCCLLLSALTLSLLLRLLPEKGAWKTAVSVLVHAFFGACLCLLARQLLPNHLSAFGIALPLLPAVSFALLREYTPSSPLPALRFSFETGLSYGLTLSVAGFVRELLGSGAILGHAFMPPVLPFLQSNAGAILLIACFAALLKFLTSKVKEDAV